PFTATSPWNDGIPEPSMTPPFFTSKSYAIRPALLVDDMVILASPMARIAAYADYMTSRDTVSIYANDNPRIVILSNKLCEKAVGVLRPFGHAQGRLSSARTVSSART